MQHHRAIARTGIGKEGGGLHHSSLPRASAAGTRGLRFELVEAFVTKVEVGRVATRVEASLKGKLGTRGVAGRRLDLAEAHVRLRSGGGIDRSLDVGVEQAPLDEAIEITLGVL